MTNKESFSKIDRRNRKSTKGEIITVVSDLLTSLEIKSNETTINGFEENEYC